MKRYIVVRYGSEVEDRHTNHWRVMVRQWEENGDTCVIVTLEGRDRTKIVERFYVSPVEVYGSKQDHTRVHLSALGNACAIAAHMEKLEDWQLSVHLT